jgi:predicted phage terminase large subunit-like protein
LLLSVYDTAFGEKQENDYSARTTWGIFKHRETTTNPQTGAVSYGKERRHIILLGAWRDKLAYHDLKREARDHYRKVRDDYTLVEHKGTGIILARDLIRGGVRGVRKVRIDHGGRVKMDKIERAKLASTVLDDGLVYYMGGRKWAKAVIDECTNFPKGTYDDWVDTAVMAWQFLRRMGEAKLWEQEDADGGVRLFKMSDKGKRALYG